MAHETPSEQRHRLQQIVQNFDTAMLVTTTADDLIRARPMRITGRVTESELWFISARESSKIEQLDEDFRAAVLMQDRGLFAFLSGMASVHDDPMTLDELWNVALRPWLPGGVANGDLVALRFVPVEGEYWDSTGIEGMKYVFSAIKAAILGQTLDVEAPSMHGTVSL